MHKTPCSTESTHRYPNTSVLYTVGQGSSNTALLAGTMHVACSRHAAETTLQRTKMRHDKEEFDQEKWGNCGRPRPPLLAASQRVQASRRTCR